MRLYQICAALLVVGGTTFIAVDLLLRSGGWFDADYLLGSPANLGRNGGIGPILLATAAIVLPAVIMALLVALISAVCVNEILRGPLLRVVATTACDVGSGVPFLVWGLFGSALFSGLCGLGLGKPAAILTLACALMPGMASGFLLALRGVDAKLRVQAMSLGLPRTAIATLMLRAATPTLVATCLIALGRGLGDSAALLFTAGIDAHMPDSLGDFALAPAPTLAVWIHHLVSTVTGSEPAAYRASAVVLLLTTISNAAALFAYRRGSPPWTRD